MITSEGLFGYLGPSSRKLDDLDLEQALSDLYAELKAHQPAFDYKIVVHPDLLKAAGWHPGDLITEYKIPIAIDVRMQEVHIGENYHQSDIWIVGKPRQRRKFRRYCKRNK